MSIEIVTSSPQAIEAAKETTRGQTLYPFDKLEVGQSFTLPAAECNIASLQVVTSRKSKKGKRFKMIQHDALGIVEVARIA
jgi:hypothetical protein